MEDFPYQRRPQRSNDFFKPYGPNAVGDNINFVGSGSSFMPYPEVVTPWEKMGVLTPNNGDSGVLNLFRRPIAPLQDLWEYSVQDKNGFIVRLDTTKYLDTGDKVDVLGKTGEWGVKSYLNDKFIYV